MNSRLWHIDQGDGPLVAIAVHDGHDLRDEVASLHSLNEAERLQEEDPHTGPWTRMARTRVIARFSRFQVDLNRPRDRAVYRRPEDAWGLTLWKQEPPADLITRSLQEYDEFYDELRRILGELKERHRRFIVYDLHSYNHRRDGPDAPAADPAGNPEVNIGTGTMDRQRWASVVDRFIADLRDFDFLGRHLDVRENVKFQGGYVSRWIHDNFSDSACVLAIEFKKFFMDEWSGELDQRANEAIQRALAATVPGVLKSLGDLTTD